MYFSKILYTGRYTPDNVVTNDDLSKLVETNDEWITSRTGIKKRHITFNENTSDIASNVAKKIIEKGNINPLDIDLIIIATISPDYGTPSTACLVQSKIGAKNAMAFDVSAACSGFLFAMSIADKYIKSGVFKNAIVVGAEVLSKYIDWTDRRTCVIFSDGAGGAYIQRDKSPGIIAEEMGSDGEKALNLTSAYVSLKNPFNENQTIDDNNKYIYMDGRAIFDFATRVIPKNIKSLLEKSGTTLDEVKYIVPHQANSRIIEIIARKIKYPMEKMYINIHDYGNTSSGTIPIALDEMFEKGMLEKGDKIILTGFGGGLTWGSMLIEI